MARFILLLFIIAAGLLFSCSSNKSHSFIDDLHNYPAIDFKSTFMDSLVLKYGLDIPSDDIRKSEQKIEHFSCFNIYGGSNKKFFFIDYFFGETCMCYYPWHYQLVIDGQGRLISKLMAESYKLVYVIKNQPPLLMTIESDPHGVGVHCFYKYDIKQDTLVNMLVGDGEGLTYNSNSWYQQNDPYELNLRIRDYNKDGYNDIIFYGQCLELYDDKTGKHCTEDKPFDRFDVEYVFLYNKKKDKFVLKN